MPLHYRGIEDDHLWRIDTENDVRPSKRRRTSAVERFEKYGIDCEEISNDHDDWKESSFSRSSMEEEYMDASSSLESSSDLMALDENDSVESLLQHYIRANSDIHFLKQGLDKLLGLVGAKDQNKFTKQRHRAEMLDSGGHWMIANLLTSLTQDYGYEPNHNETSDSMNDHDVDVRSTHNNSDEELVVNVVTRSCQILRELLLTNSADKTNADAIVRYQIYCAGGLDAVVSALKRFPSSFEVQLAGCQFLSQLLSIQGNSETDTDASSSSSNPTTTTLIKNLYQSTDRLTVIVRLVAGGTKSSLNNNNNNAELFLSSTQMWQLFFVVADIVRSVVRQSTLDSSCRSEVIQTVEEYLNCNTENNDTTMAIDSVHVNKGFGNSSGISRASYSNRSSSGSKHNSGIGKYMYEHLMTILVDEEDCYEAEVSSTYMNE
eukprot:CAMPEP_0116120978 /NCGR_PEP_ID=MMETSP0329-20121206/3459_1 /TAXON_ID=697910 /ORGANISM="Pseudo-nitzschia arenysensis, Strain B593" /LENGTH=432 /DNA_ID=CAMNT_0003614775 /DNA_START=199 /DNA_END=1497 /DNA_ORIENTATION=-